MYWANERGVLVKVFALLIKIQWLAYISAVNKQTKNRNYLIQLYMEYFEVHKKYKIALVNKNQYTVVALHC